MAGYLLWIPIGPQYSIDTYAGYGDTSDLSIPTKENPEFIACMEDVLDVYELPYDEKRPVVCMDEKPYQLASV